MTLDDRLRTVLGVAVDGERAALAQYRQLVDLLGSGGTVADGQLVASAFLRLSVLSRRLPAAERVAILREPGLRLRTASLVAQLCEGDVTVGEAAIDAAALNAADWDAVIPMLRNGLSDRAQARRAALSVETPVEAPVEASVEAKSGEDERTGDEGVLVLEPDAAIPDPEASEKPAARPEEKPEPAPAPQQARPKAQKRPEPQRAPSAQWRRRGDGKTGTAEYGTDVPPRTHSWFAGFQGDVAVAVLVEDGGFGAEAAVHVADRFFTELNS